jgi:hypothetical protein
MSADLLDAGQREATRGENEIQLAKGQTYALRLEPNSDLFINVLAGCFWVTLEGDALDYVASPGAPLVLSGEGLVVLEGVDSCNVLTRCGWF